MGRRRRAAIVAANVDTHTVVVVGQNLIGSGCCDRKWRSFMKPRCVARLAASSCFLLLAGCLFAFQPGAYHLLKKIPLGAAEGGGEYFDYITFDAAARRVYL